MAATGEAGKKEMNECGKDFSEGACSVGDHHLPNVKGGLTNQDRHIRSAVKESIVETIIIAFLVCGHTPVIRYRH